MTRRLTNFEMQKYYQNEPKIKAVYSQSNLPKIIKDGGYLVNFDEYKSVQMHWIALYTNGNSVTYFESFIVEHITAETKIIIGINNMITNISRIQAYDSIIGR